MIFLKICLVPHPFFDTVLLGIVMVNESVVVIFYFGFVFCPIREKKFCDVARILVLCLIHFSELYFVYFLPKGQVRNFREI